MSTPGVRDGARNYVIVGAFVLLMLLALVLWIALLSGRTGATDRYTIAYTNVMGLAEGAPVSFQGYRIGKVERIAPATEGDGSNFHVEVTVQSRWRIPSDSVARMVTSGLLAAVAIDIESGESEDLVAPGGRIQSLERDDVLAVVSSVAAQIGHLVEDLEPLLLEIGEGAPEIVANVRELTEKLNETADRLNGIVNDANATRIASILEELERASRTAASLASDFEQTRAGLDDLLASADALVDENRSDVRRAVADLRDTLDAFARGADALSANLETASQNLVEFSDDIRRDPSLLLRGRSEGE